MEETKLIPVLVQAVKELETTNEKMKDQISVLTSEIAKLQKDIADLKARKDGTRER
jgi:phage shock protein A